MGIVNDDFSALDLVHGAHSTIEMGDLAICLSDLDSCHRLFADDVEMAGVRRDTGADNSDYRSNDGGDRLS